LETILSFNFALLVKSTVVEVFHDENNSLGKESTMIPVPDVDLLMNTVGPQSCGEGKVPRFLKTRDFTLDGHDDLVLENTPLDDCIKFCLNNYVKTKIPTYLQKYLGERFRIQMQLFRLFYSCQQMHIVERSCGAPGKWAAKTVGGLCILRKGMRRREIGQVLLYMIPTVQFFSDCPIVYNRFPQKILVGFAETVIDSPTLQECFDNCLNSQKMYFFKKPFNYKT